MCSTYAQRGNSGMSNSKGWVELGAAVASYPRKTDKEETVRLLGMIPGGQYMRELMGEKGGLGRLVTDSVVPPLGRGALNLSLEPKSPSAPPKASFSPAILCPVS